MEYNSFNDFCLIFKPEYNKEGNVKDYILEYVSDSFQNAANISPGLILGKRFSEIAVENSDKLGFKEMYIVINPNSKSKHTTYLKDLERWYLINIFNCTQNYNGHLIISYIDITDIKQSRMSRFIYSENFKDRLFNIKYRGKMLYRDKLTGLYNRDFLKKSCQD